MQKKESLLVELLPSLVLAMGDDLPAQRHRALLVAGRPCRPTTPAQPGADPMDWRRYTVIAPP